MQDQTEYVQQAFRKAKQQFLIAEILDLNYDSDAFLSFCQDKKSSDIDEWTLEELDLCVQEFKKTHKPIPKLKKEPIKSQVVNIVKPIDPLEKVRKVLGKVSDSVVEVEPVNHNELSRMGDVKILVCNPEIVDPGLFSSKYYQFVVNTQPVNWLVKRKIEDFLWIRDMLVNDFPGVYIPPIHKSSKSKLEEKGLYKRQVLYSVFLNNTASNQVLRTSQLFLAFLKEADLKLYIRAAKKPYRIQKISQIKSLNQEITCIFEELLDKYEHINTFLIKTDKILVELLEKLKKLIHDSVTLADSIQNYAEIISESKQNYLSIKNEIGASIYEDVENSLHNWADFIMKSTKNIYEDMIIPIKVYKMDMLTLKDLIKDKDTALANYKCSLGKTNFNELKEVFGYFNCACFTQCEKIMGESLTQLQNKMAAGFKKKSDESLQFHLIWGQLIEQLSITY
ncbi:hypothetical protein SteCoe_27481 [Stentor coeruleus]|uniref:PX domain-containing protein n=1 Tax=Stentor coeruleus TaxID=5963 RepID=A0A1R2BAZ6_9CILI|nr:hypothetical protein SteCoe_27481 [Stentor coeruleus]